MAFQWYIACLYWAMYGVAYIVENLTFQNKCTHDLSKRLAPLIENLRYIYRGIVLSVIGKYKTRCGFNFRFNTFLLRFVFNVDLRESLKLRFMTTFLECIRIWKDSAWTSLISTPEIYPYILFTNVFVRPSVFQRLSWSNHWTYGPDFLHEHRFWL